MTVSYLGDLDRSDEEPSNCPEHAAVLDQAVGVARPAMLGNSLETGLDR